MKREDAGATRGGIASVCCGVLWLVVGFSYGCGDESSGKAGAASDVSSSQGTDISTQAHDVSTTTDNDAMDLSDTTGGDIGAPNRARAFSHRAIGGVSMGAAGARIALQHPELFDVGGAMGGYISLQYMVSTGLRLHLGGFCPLEALEANITGINDPFATPATFCGPGETLYELEFSQDFNHLHHDTHGADFNREFYIDVFRALSLGFGNFTTESPSTSPYLPLGVSPEWYSETSSQARCDSPPPIPQSMAYNAEYNPTGAYSVIPVCDSDNRVTEGLGGADYDPNVEHKLPTDILLSVDLNGNGRRDYGEPIFLNASERYEDVGNDGCGNEREDGNGGCLAAALTDVDGDPNGDDYHWRKNASGTERNDRWDPGEPYLDYGFDGVPDTLDAGEGNGTYDLSQAMHRAAASDAQALISELTDEELASLDLYFDSGIRDPLHAAVSTRHAVGRLATRTDDWGYFQGIADRVTALYSDTKIEEVVNVLGDADRFAAETIGKHVYVEYGDPDASQAALDAGDGGHLGTIEEVLARMLTFYAFALHRLPDPDTSLGGSFNAPVSKSYYSTLFQARRNYTVVVPPGYDANPEKRYPVLYVLHGLGQAPDEFADIAIVTSGMMASGLLPKAIQVYVDGTCCRAYKNDHNQRECACSGRIDGVRQCVDPTCTGPHESCDIREIPDSELTSECVRASLYLDLLTNRWGETRDDMQYGSTIIELVEHIDATYRTRGQTKRF